MEKKYDYTLDYVASSVQHFGVSLYKQLPKALAELITNCWDADATEVNIDIDYSKKIITVTDNGIGMSHSELNSEFLRVARNRRLKDNFERTSRGRKVTGKKGLGKLALFGIARNIQVYSWKNGKENAFEMKYEDIKNTDDSQRYHPRTISVDKNIDHNNGTKIVISDLALENITPLEILKESLARRFDKYSSEEFLVLIRDENKKEIRLDENVFEYSIKPKKVQFIYEFPKDFEDENSEEIKYLLKLDVKGKIYLNRTPLPATEEGFSVLARGKLAGDKSKAQFSDRANDLFYNYATGYFQIDYIDDEKGIDYISTDRQQVIWDSSSELLKLRASLNSLMGIIQKRWRTERKKANDAKKKDYTLTTPVDDNKDVTLDDIENSSNFTQKDRIVVDNMWSIIEADGNNFSEDKKEEAIKAVYRTTDAYVRDNSVYKELVPSNFKVPENVGPKIRRLREEAVAAATLEEPDRFILTQGLLLRALIDSTTCVLLVKNFDEARNLEIFKGVKIRGKDISNPVDIENLPLAQKYKLMVQFLKKKKVINRHMDSIIKDFEDSDAVKSLNMLMHDGENWPKLDRLKIIWDTVSPQLIKVFGFM